MIIVAGISAVAAYQAGGIALQGTLETKEQEISHKAIEITELQKTISELETSDTGDCPASGGGGGELICSTCHGLEQTKGFHSVGDIKLLSESKGQTPRICTTCHGSQPHNVHKKKTDSGEMSCEDCHVNDEGDFVTPKVPEGKLLVCELCHAFSGKPEDVGNYVSIHVVEGNRECSICHMGDAIKIHKRATEKLGVVE